MTKAKFAKLTSNGAVRWVRADFVCVIDENNLNKVGESGGSQVHIIDDGNSFHVDQSPSQIVQALNEALDSEDP